MDSVFEELGIVQRGLGTVACLETQGWGEGRSFHGTDQRSEENQGAGEREIYAMSLKFDLTGLFSCSIEVV